MENRYAFNRLCPTDMFIGVTEYSWGTGLQTGRPRARFPIVSLEFFIDVVEPVSNRN